MSIQRVKSKWLKTKWLLKSSYISRFIPDTRKYSEQSLSDMLKTYGMVYVKPINGTFGIGVIRVDRVVSPYLGYRLQYGTTKLFFAKLSDLASRLSRKIYGRPYIVQRGIHLLKHRKRVFDIRVMVQMNPSNQWEVTGIIGRLAHPRKIVTNYHSGGTIMSIEQLMSDHMNAAALHLHKSRLRKLSIAIAKQLQLRYPNIKEIGVDVAVDQKLAPWVLEVNTNPDPFIFRKLSDKSIFAKIYQYSLAYKKFKRRKHKARSR